MQAGVNRPSLPALFGPPNDKQTIKIGNGRGLAEPPEIEPLHRQRSTQSLQSLLKTTGPTTMQITEICVYQVDLPLHEGSYKWSGGNSVSVFDSTIVAIKTDHGLTGYGEVCPLGPAYLPAYAAGARTGIAELGPQLIGLDPTQLGVINRRMDQSMRGHPYVKSALDMACWDLLGKASSQSVATLLGGSYGDDFALYRAISQDSPAAMARNVDDYRAQGYTKFQLKVGGNPDTDIERIA